MTRSSVALTDRYQHIGGSERAVFRGERIELLEVTITEETLSRLMSYAATYVQPGRR